MGSHVLYSSHHCQPILTGAPPTSLRPSHSASARFPIELGETAGDTCRHLHKWKEMATSERRCGTWWEEHSGEHLHAVLPSLLATKASFPSPAAPFLCCCVAHAQVEFLPLAQSWPPRCCYESSPA